MPPEKLPTSTTTDNSLSPSINSNFYWVFKGHCLKQKIATSIPCNRIIFFVYEWDTWLRDLNSDFA